MRENLGQAVLLHLVRVRMFFSIGGPAAGAAGAAARAAPRPGGRLSEYQRD